MPPGAGPHRFGVRLRGLYRRAAGLALAALLAGALAACQPSSKPPVFVPERFPFSDKPPLVFDLAHIEIVKPTAPTAPAASLPESRPAPVPLGAALDAWAAERLRAAGRAGTLRLVLREASAVVIPLETDAGLEGLFTAEQAERLELRLSAVIEIVDESGALRGHASAAVRRTRTLPEGLTLDERERLYREAADALLADYDSYQEQSIRRYLGAWLQGGA